MWLYRRNWGRFLLVYLFAGAFGLIGVGVIVTVNHDGVPAGDTVFIWYYVDGFVTITLVKYRSDYEKAQIEAEYKELNSLLYDSNVKSLRQV